MGLALGVVLLSACSATRHLPVHSYLLTESRIEIAKEPELSKDEAITRGELDRYVRQHPNGRFLGTNLPVWIYMQADSAKKNGWNRFKRRLGSAPVLWDSAQTALSANAMKIYLNSRGFLDAATSFAVDTARRRAKVTYRAAPGEPFRIGTIAYTFQDKFIGSIILTDTSSSLLRSGNIFDANVLDAERVRITNFLKDQGYYNFSINNIFYRADSTVGDRRVDLTMVVKQHMVGYDADGEAILDNNRIYRLQRIYLFPDYDPTKAATDSLYLRNMDTVSYRGLYIVYKGKQQVRSDILRRTVNLYPNALYDADQVKRTYDNIMRLGYYKSASILFSEAPDSTSHQNFISYIGADSLPQEEANYTTEHYLSCNIYCTPALRQSYTLDLEGTTSSDYLGIMAKVGYQNRNLLRGVELFDVNVRGGYEFLRSSSKYNTDSYEFGINTSLSFPRLITPFRVNRYNRALNPRTKIDVTYNIQRRPYYHRDLASAVWGYSWGKKRSSFTLRPIDISIINMRYVDSVFLEQLKNPYLVNSYTSQIIAGLSGSYLYNTQNKNSQAGSLTLRVNFETNGNLIDALYAMFARQKEDEQYYKLFGIRYAQYFRTDASLTKRFYLGDKSSLVYRFYGGFGYAYGNSESMSIPMERLFYCGGSNSMRGWVARTLGPGNEPRTETEYPSQMGNMRLEMNLEARFPVWGFLHGALFCDVGNIWFAKQGVSDPRGEFKFGTFYKQLGFNTGIGARLDFNFFILRLDWGIQMHNPNKEAGERWVIKHFNLNNTTLNFGVGYPF